MHLSSLSKSLLLGSSFRVWLISPTVPLICVLLGLRNVSGLVEARPLSPGGAILHSQVSFHSTAQTAQLLQHFQKFTSLTK